MSFVCLFCFWLKPPFFMALSAKHANFKETHKRKNNTTCEHTSANCSCQNVRFIRKILMSIKCLSAILGPKMAAPILWARGKIAFFVQETHVHKIPRFREGGGNLGLGGEGSADFIFMGARIFLTQITHLICLPWRPCPRKLLCSAQICQIKFLGVQTWHWHWHLIQIRSVLGQPLRTQELSSWEPPRPPKPLDAQIANPKNLLRLSLTSPERRKLTSN